MSSAAKIVKVNIFRLNAQVVEHFQHGLGHHGRPAHIIVDIFRSRMFVQVFIKKDLMDKAGQAVPVVLRQRLGEGRVKRKGLVLPGKFLKLFGVKKLLRASPAVPVRSLEMYDKQRDHIRTDGLSSLNYPYKKRAALQLWAARLS